jgi:hypothetical protein
MSTGITTFAEEEWGNYISIEEEEILHPKISNLEKKKLEERKLSEEADFKLTIDLFSDFSLGNPGSLGNKDKEKEKVIKKEKKEDSTKKKERNEKINAIRRRIRDAKNYHANIDKVYGSSNSDDNSDSWIDYEDSMLR